MIEHATLARASNKPPRLPTRWKHPTLPRGPSPIGRRLTKLRARIAALVAPRRRGSCC